MHEKIRRFAPGGVMILIGLALVATSLRSSGLSTPVQILWIISIILTGPLVVGAVLGRISVKVAISIFMVVHVIKILVTLSLVPAARELLETDALLGPIMFLALLLWARYRFKQFSS